MDYVLLKFQAHLAIQMMVRDILVRLFGPVAGNILFVWLGGLFALPIKTEATEGC